MKIKSMIQGSCVMLLMIFCSAGCASAALQNNEASNASVSRAKKQPKRVGRELLKAFVEDKGEEFLSLLPEVVSTQFGLKGFKKTRESMVEQLGEPVAYAFVMNLEHPLFTISIWRILFLRKSADGKKDIRQEGLFRAVAGRIDGKERLLSFNFF